MESILPSEIARLVLGYLEEQKCVEAAAIFLEASPLLQECYAVTKRGGKFARKVNGITLTDLIEKFCAINILVQERLNKLEDCEQLKHTGDLLEQLKYLMDGPKGQRFVVNINVPPQNPNQMPGGSPIISSSMRKRRHSGQADKERFKKPCKSTSPVTERGPEFPLYDMVETTSLDQLPGHLGSKTKTVSSVDTTGQDDDPRLQCSSTVAELPVQQQQPRLNLDNHIESTMNLVEKTTTTQDNVPKESAASSHKCETGTNTQEFMAYTNTEVQTIPFQEAAFNIGSELIDGPVENLSLLTKELLNRIELQERIAETINRALIPTEASFRESSFTDNAPGECNTSIMRELDNAIKSIVIETETDPVFEKFLLETIGQGMEGETSPDEDAVHSPKTNDSPSKLSSVSSTHEHNIEERPVTDLILDSSPNKENSEKQQAKDDNPPPANANKSLDTDKEFRSLDDMNAQAVLSIINVNNITKESQPENEPLCNNALIQPQPKGEAVPNQPEVIIETIGSNQIDPKTNSINNNNRKKRNIRPKRERKKLTPKKQIPEHEIVPIPTLIVCSQEEIANMRIPIAPTAVRPKSQFVPIMPKTSAMALPPEKPLFLRAVNVVRSTPISEPANPSMFGLEVNSKSNKNNQFSDKIAIAKECEPKTSESITLYGGDGEAFNNEATAATTTVIQTNIPSVEVDESISLCGTGLSPYLKLNRKASSKPEETAVNDDTNKSLVVKQNCDMLAKRTPRSIMKSRSRNHRLSLSTPRRRSSHIRALDFSTPTKGFNTSRRLSSDSVDKSTNFCPKSSKQLSKACRASLFKSPPFSGTPSSPIKRKVVKTPIKMTKPKIAIATKCPASTKLIGGWDKITGVGMIIGGSTEKTSISPVNQKSWDADLRMAVMADVEPVGESANTTKNKKKKIVKNTNPKRNNSRKEKSAEEREETDMTVADNEPVSVNSPEVMANCPPGIITKESYNNKPNNQVQMELTEKLSESITTTVQNIDGQVVTKKYAKLKTLTTTVTKGANLDRKESSLTDSKVSGFGNMPELETPRKFDPNLVPPTPRVLSPSNTMTCTPFAQLQLNDNSGKVQSFISTPEFPPTPCINLTPKQQSNDNTIIDDVKKDGYGSKYYQPSSELKQRSQPANLTDQGDTCQVITMLSSSVDQSISSNKAIVSTSKLEITQFEVIKDNLPKEQAIKELKIAKSCAENNSIDAPLSPINIDDPNVSSKSLDSNGTVDDSSGSGSDSSSSSSSSCSTCSTCDDTNTSSRISISIKCNKTSHKINCDNSTQADCTQGSPAMFGSLQKLSERSPAKVVPIIKDDKELLELETPAKDESILPEADISETPSSSKAGIESLTNLNSKISAIIKQDAVSKVKANIIESLPVDEPKAKPRIVSIETIVSCPVIQQLAETAMETDADANKAIADAKLSRELDEKRLRIINKLKADLSPAKSRINRPKEPIKTKNNKKITKTTCQPVRKSVRNAEKRAKRGLSEPVETPDHIAEKIKVQRKAQSSRESSNNDDGHIENIITSMATATQVQEAAKTKSQETQQTNKVDKCKVELIKRDLFSDDESNGIKISKPEANCNDTFQQNDNKPEQQQSNAQVNSELLPGVLESLHLVPTNKTFEENSDLDINSYEHIEISFVYNETVPTKKRRRKISNSELEMKVQTWSESGNILWQTMTTTPYDEIFNINPPRKRRAVKVVLEKPPTTLVARRKRKIQLKNSRAIVSAIKSQPLATSSPAKDISPKAVEKKAKIIQKPKPFDKVPKPRKGKHSDCSRDDKAEDSNEKRIHTADPKLLLSKINIDNFLNQVHGPVS